MNWKTWALLALALVLGFGAAYGVKAIFFDSRDNDAIALDPAQAGACERLLVANGDVLAGMELTAQNVRFVLMPEQDVPRDGIVSFNGVPGRIVTRDLKDGEPISLYDLEEPRAETASSAVFVPPGYVVVPIEICSVSKETGSMNYLKSTKLDKIVKPGDAIDISVAKEDRSRESTGLRRLVTETVAQEVAVFDVLDEKRFGSDGAERYSSISALLTAEQVETIRKAYGEGKLKLTLRNGYDEQTPMELFSQPGAALFSPAQNVDGSVWQTTRSNGTPTLNENFIIGGNIEPASNSHESSAAPMPTSGSSAFVEPESVVAINSGLFLGGEKAAEEGADATEREEEQSANVAHDVRELPNQNDPLLPPSQTELSDTDLTVPEPKNTPLWSRVSFDQPDDIAPPTSSSSETASDNSWIGERTFRFREQAPASSTLSDERYNLAPSQTQVADLTDPEEFAKPEAQSTSTSTAAKPNDNSKVNNVPKVNPIKKVSPFITTPAKAKTNRNAQ